MNSFYKEIGELKFTCNIKKNGPINTKNLCGEISKEIKDMNENEKFNLVYVYYLVKKKFKYPKGKSDVLYIGSTEGEKNNGKKSASFRFKHLMNGQDKKQNITLRVFYEKGCKIGLDIFECKDGCREKEKELTYKFLDKYGALPIASGAAFSKDKMCIVSTDEKIESTSTK